MEKFVWAEEYSISKSEIDQEHQKLFALANDMLKLADQGEEVTKVKEAIVALYDYAKVHFGNEEKFMEEVYYRDLPHHKRLHDNIISEMNTIMKHSGSLDSVVYKFKRLMCAWATKHIPQEDTRIIPSLKIAGKGSP